MTGSIPGQIRRNLAHRGMPGYMNRPILRIQHSLGACEAPQGMAPTTLSEGADTRMGEKGPTWTRPRSAGNLSSSALRSIWNRMLYVVAATEAIGAIRTGWATVIGTGVAAKRLASRGEVMLRGNKLVQC